MSAANALLLLSIANTAMETAQKANAVLSKAAAEGRDVSDAEVDKLVSENDALSDGLIKRLRG